MGPRQKNGRDGQAASDQAANALEDEGRPKDLVAGGLLLQDVADHDVVQPKVREDCEHG
ncbi:hypothetical protein D3C87_1800440 [compost metagenome]